MIERKITKDLESYLFQGKILMIVWPRQVGKTTLVEQMLAKHADERDIIRFSWEYSADYDLLDSRDFPRLVSAIGDRKWIFIDEWQKIPHIWTTLKILTDHYKDTKTIFVTGSSSFHLLSHTSEALTGRKRVFTLYPFSFGELVQAQGFHETDTRITSYLKYGMYPWVVLAQDEREKQRALIELASSWLYRDILEFQEVKNPSILTKLLKLLALQIGSEVSLSSLGAELGMDSRTVERYIDLLEKSYIIYRIPPFYSNKRKEITKMQKIYFYDIGIRNAFLDQFSDIENRIDKWNIWENWLITERKKHMDYSFLLGDLHFWRGSNQQEIDLVQDGEGRIRAYEIKWKLQNSRIPSLFQELYPSGEYSEVNRENYSEFLK